jgi:hypothetical protein
MNFEAGFAAVEITPPIGPISDLDIPFYGDWNAPRREFESLHDNLFVRAMVLTHDLERVAIVSVDSMGDGVGYGARARELIAEETGLAGHQVMILDTGAPNTPDTGGWSGNVMNSHWVEEIAHRIAAVVQRAYKNRVPASVRLMGTVLSGCSVNTGTLSGQSTYAGRLGKLHIESGPMDPEMWVIGAYDEYGKALGALVNFGCKPAGIRDEPVISAGYTGLTIGELQLTCEQGFIGLFSVGAAANVYPAFRGRSDRMKQQAEAVGHTAKALLNGEWTKHMAVLGGPLAIESTSFTLPRRRDLPQVSRIDENIARLARLTQRSGEAGTGDPRSPLAQELYHWREMRALSEQPTEVSIHIQAIRCGDFALVGINGDVDAQIGLDIKEGAGKQLIAVASMANGYAGLIAEPAAYERECDEVKPSRRCPLDRAAGPVIRDRAIALIDQLFSQMDRSI